MKNILNIASFKTTVFCKNLKSVSHDKDDEEAVISSEASALISKTMDINIAGVEERPQS